MKMRRLIGDFYFTVNNKGVFLRQPILLRGRIDIRAKYDFELMHFDTIEELVIYLRERVHIIKKKVGVNVEELIEKIYENIEVIHHKVNIEKMVKNSINLGVRWQDRLSPNKIRYENLAKEREESERIENEGVI